MSFPVLSVTLRFPRANNSFRFLVKKYSQNFIVWKQNFQLNVVAIVFKYKLMAGGVGSLGVVVVLIFSCDQAAL